MSTPNAAAGRLPIQLVGIALPAVLLALLLGTIAWQTGLLELPRVAAEPVAASPLTTTIAPRPFVYRVAGDHQLEDGTIIDAPVAEIDHPQSLEIMTYQVTAGEYARCVAAKACAPPQGRQVDAAYPVTGVSFDDATDYAVWLSAATGADWRLPSVEEWVFAAAERAVDPALGVLEESENPADRWLANYERESSLGRANIALQPAGSGGMNSVGVADLAGAVWEWTSTCNSRTTFDAAGGVVWNLEACGVRLLEGQHRTPMSAFVRDARAGGCSTGQPPDALGFRLVREPSIAEKVFAWGKGLVGSR
ncbi:MAG: formylglycine-generating enzyme family protein [Alphaproteobacteria bacterium]|nr:MAG: formylglycine-generating enzyme family protein [Alphaproteobacteria bacterium]